MSDEERAAIEACRKALTDAGWVVAEEPSIGRAVRVTARRGNEFVCMGHPAGLLRTYQYVCSSAGVSVFLWR